MNPQPAHSSPQLADARRCHSTGDLQGVTAHRACRAACWDAFSAGTQHSNGIKTSQTLTCHVAMKVVLNIFLFMKSILPEEELQNKTHKSNSTETAPNVAAADPALCTVLGTDTFLQTELSTQAALRGCQTPFYLPLCQMWVEKETPLCSQGFGYRGALSRPQRKSKHIPMLTTQAVKRNDRPSCGWMQHRAQSDVRTRTRGRKSPARKTFVSRKCEDFYSFEEVKT